MYLFLKRSGKRLLKSPQLLACSAWGASAGLGCHLGSTCQGLGQIPGGHKQIWTCKEHWWRRKPFQIRWRRVIQRSSGRLVSALHNLTNLRLCSHLVPEHWYKIVWTLGTNTPSIKVPSSARVQGRDLAPRHGNFPLVLVWELGKRCVHISAQRESYSGTVLGQQVWT